MKNGLAGLLLTAGLLPVLQAQEIWRHVDEHGSVQYADRPFAGAVRVELSEKSLWSSRTATPSGFEDRGPTSAPPRDGGDSALAITRPAAGETVWGPGGALEVTIEAAGQFEPGSRLALELDGVETGWRGELPAVRLNEVWRGGHRLRARLLDAQGKELASSKEIRFFKREASVVKPAAQAPGDSRLIPPAGWNP